MIHLVAYARPIAPIQIIVQDMSALDHMNNHRSTISQQTYALSSGELKPAKTRCRPLVLLQLTYN